MPHDHAHIDPEAGDRKVIAAIGVNLLLTVAQIIGGVVSGSLALIADALHNLSDMASLVIAYAARRIARRPADARMTFGYGRAEIVAALVNYTTLILIALYLVYEAVMAFLDPQPVDGWLVVIIAALALIVDATTAALTFALSKTSANIRAAFLHNLADALGSVVVIISGTLILLYDWRLIDPAATLLIAGYILWQAGREIGGVIRILMLGSPPDMDLRAILDRLERIEGVAGLHHVHFWLMQEHQPALDAHVVIAPQHWDKAATVKARLRDSLERDFGIRHCTLELERADETCPTPRRIGHHTSRN